MFNKVPMMVVLTILLGLFASSALAEQLIYSVGRAEIVYSSSKPTVETKEEAVRAAKVKAIESYFSNQNSAESRSFDQQESSITSNIDYYIISSTILGEADFKERKRFAVTIQVALNINRLSEQLKPKGVGLAGKKAELAFLFITRQVASLKTFDDRIVKRVDTNQSLSVQGNGSESLSETESIRKNRVVTGSSNSSQLVANANTSSVIESGGSNTKKAGERVYRLGNSQTFNAAFLEILTVQDWPYDPIEAETEPKLKLKKVKEDFSRGDDIQSDTLQALVQDLKLAEFKYFALGTVDIGLPSIDPLIALPKVPVELNAKVYDVSGRRVKTILTVEPVLVNGFASDEATAQSKAVKEAAKRAAKEFLDQLANKNITDQ